MPDILRHRQERRSTQGGDISQYDGRLDKHPAAFFAYRPYDVGCCVDGAAFFAPASVSAPRSTSASWRSASIAERGIAGSCRSASAANGARRRGCGAAVLRPATATKRKHTTPVPPYLLCISHEINNVYFLLDSAVASPLILAVFLNIWDIL